MWQMSDFGQWRACLKSHFLIVSSAAYSVADIWCIANWSTNSYISKCFETCERKFCRKPIFLYFLTKIIITFEKVISPCIQLPCTYLAMYIHEYMHRYILYGTMMQCSSIPNIFSRLFVESYFVCLLWETRNYLGLLIWNSHFSYLLYDNTVHQ